MTALPTLKAYSAKKLRDLMSESDDMEAVRWSVLESGKHGLGKSPVTSPKNFAGLDQ